MKQLHLIATVVGGVFAASPGFGGDLAQCLCPVTQSGGSPSSLATGITNAAICSSTPLSLDRCQISVDCLDTGEGPACGDAYTPGSAPDTSTLQNLIPGLAERHASEAGIGDIGGGVLAEALAASEFALADCLGIFSGVIETEASVSDLVANLSPEIDPDRPFQSQGAPIELEGEKGVTCGVTARGTFYVQFYREGLGWEPEVEWINFQFPARQ